MVTKKKISRLERVEADRTRESRESIHLRTNQSPWDPRFPPLHLSSLPFSFVLLTEFQKRRNRFSYFISANEKKKAEVGIEVVQVSNNLPSVLL